jgi:hypothetical protein
MTRIIILLLIILTPLAIFSEEVIDNRSFYLHKDVDELAEFNWGNFLTCLQSVKLSNDEEPRELNLQTSRLVMATIEKKKWVFSVREDERSVILESITINTKKYYSLNDKRRLFLKIVGNCQL